MIGVTSCRTKHPFTQPDARQLTTGPVPVEAAKELVATAYGKQSSATFDARPELRCTPREIRSDHALLAILTTTDVDEVRARWELLAA